MVEIKNRKLWVTDLINCFQKLICYSLSNELFATLYCFKPQYMQLSVGLDGGVLAIYTFVTKLFWRQEPKKQKKEYLTFFPLLSVHKQVTLLASASGQVI